MNQSRLILNSSRYLKVGATLLATAGLLLSVPRAVCACYPPLHGPYDEPGNHTVDTIASSMALFSEMGVGLLCGTAMVPADAYEKIEHPQSDFGALVSGQVCAAPAQLAERAGYLAGGLPFYAGKKFIWDLPRAALPQDDARPPGTHI